MDSLYVRAVRGRVARDARALHVALRAQRNIVSQSLQSNEQGPLTTSVTTSAHGSSVSLNSICLLSNNSPIDLESEQLPVCLLVPSKQAA